MQLTYLGEPGVTCSPKTGPRIIGILRSNRGGQHAEGFTDEDHRGPEGGGRGSPTAEVCRRHGVSPGTFYNWKARFGGIGVSEARRLAICRLSSCWRSDARQSRLAGMLRKNASLATGDHAPCPGAGASASVTCRLMGIHRSVARYRRVSDAPELLKRLRSLPRSGGASGIAGCGCCCADFGVNHKRVYRLYREEGLSVRRRIADGGHRSRPHDGARAPEPAVVDGLRVRCARQWPADTSADGD